MLERIAAIIVLLLLALASPASAKGHGGHVTTFDCNVWGGVCACWMTQASGRCGNATAHDVGGACAGGDESTAMVNWQTYAHGLGRVRSVLFIPPGCRMGTFVSTNNNSFAGDITINCPGFSPNPDTSVYNGVIWGYGATLTTTNFGTGTFYSHTDPHTDETSCPAPNNTVALIQTAAAGNTTITAVTAGDIAEFVVGDWIGVIALGMQGCQSAPINPQIFEYKLITAINYGTGVITLNEPLKYGPYKSTYPILTYSNGVTCTDPFNGGAAAAVLVQKTFDSTMQYYGLSVIGDGIQFQPLIKGGKNSALIDMNLYTGLGPSAGLQRWIIGGYVMGPVEVDKDMDLLVWQGAVIDGIQMISVSTNLMLVQNSQINRFFSGTGSNAKFSNVKLGVSMLVGTAGFGAATSLELDSVSVQFYNFNAHYDLISNYSLSGGVLSINNLPTFCGQGCRGLWVPGHQYYMGDFDGGNDCSVPNTFTVSDVTVSAGTMQITTNIPGSIPVGLICGTVRPVSTFGSFSLQTLTQRFSGPGNPLNNLETLP